jgi:hypothetical protein
MLGSWLTKGIVGVLPWLTVALVMLAARGGLGGRSRSARETCRRTEYRLQLYRERGPGPQALRDLRLQAYA